MLAVRASGTLMCLASATAFGAMAVFGKLAYENGVTVGTLLAVRFAIAAIVFWAALLAGGAAGELRGLRRRDVFLGLGLGAVGYAGQAASYFAALERVEASLLALVLYTYPVIVTAAAVLLGRDRLSAPRLVALALTSCGLALVLAGAGTGTLDPLGCALGVAASLIYSAYILVSDGVTARMRAPVLATLVCTGAAMTLAVGSASLGQLRPGAVTLAGWGWLASLALVSTVTAIGLFFAALKRIGPSTTSILSTAEPVVTVVLAFLVFGETLSGVQELGGAFVVAGVLALHVRLRRLPVGPAPRRAAQQASSS
jgi:drug/metabolite transporter (DMT)-like permease